MLLLVACFPGTITLDRVNFCFTEAYCYAPDFVAAWLHHARQFLADDRREGKLRRLLLTFQNASKHLDEMKVLQSSLPISVPPRTLRYHRRKLLAEQIANSACYKVGGVMCQGMVQLLAAYDKLRCPLPEKEATECLAVVNGMGVRTKGCPIIPTLMQMEPSARKKAALDPSARKKLPPPRSGKKRH